jgi:hypothetical protein
MATFDYQNLQATATRLIERFGGDCTITHLTGSSSRGTMAAPTHLSVDESTEVGTVSSTSVVGFITNVRNPVCVGDTVTGYSKTWRVRESTQYRGPTVDLAYRVLLDS